MSSVESLLLSSDFLFQQDYDPKVISKFTEKWLSEK